MFREGLTAEQQIDLWENQREIKNLMGRFSFAILFKEEQSIFDRFWSRREDVCYGVNSGWYSGPDAIQDYYKALDAKRRKADEIKLKRFPKAFENQNDVFGIGSMDVKPLGSELVEIAGDGRTAKGMWWCHGQYLDDTPTGPITRYTCGMYAVDFVREDDAWKIWHMQYLEEINCACGSRWWGKPTKEYRTFPEFAEMSEIVLPEPNIPETLREYYSTERKFQRFPAAPRPYFTFDETFSYGVGKRVCV